MRKGGGCLYVQGNVRLDLNVRGEGDGREWWGEDFEGVLER